MCHSDAEHMVLLYSANQKNINSIIFVQGYVFWLVQMKTKPYSAFGPNMKSQTKRSQFNCLLDMWHSIPKYFGTKATAWILVPKSNDLDDTKTEKTCSELMNSELYLDPR